MILWPWWSNTAKGFICNGTVKPGTPFDNDLDSVVELDASMILVADGSFAYTGSAKRPFVCVRVKGKMLKKGVDYKVTFKNNCYPGTASVTVTPLEGGMLTGAPVTKTFEIAWNKLKPDYYRMTVADQQYTGSPVKPHVKFEVYNSGKDVFEEWTQGVDYEVEWYHNTKKGAQAAAVVSLLPSEKNKIYKGAYIKRFNIVSKANGSDDSGSTGVSAGGAAPSASPVILRTDKNYTYVLEATESIEVAFNAPKNKYFTIRTKALGEFNDQGSVSKTLYANGKTIKHSAMKKENCWFNSSEYILPTGTPVDVRLANNTDSSQEITVCMKTDELDGIEVEDNGSMDFDHATQIGVDEIRQGIVNHDISDIDCYVFVAPQRGVYKVYTQLTNDVGKIARRVFIDGKAVAKGTYEKGTGKKVSKEFELSKGQSAFIEVKSNGSASGASMYSLQVAQVSVANDSEEEAHVVADEKLPSAPDAASNSESAGIVDARASGASEGQDSKSGLTDAGAKSASEKKVVKLAGTKIKSAKALKGRKVAITWVKNKKATGYEVRISTSKRFSNGKTRAKTIKGNSKIKCSFTKLKKKTKYYVQVRCVCKKKAKTYKSTWSAKRAVKTLKR